MAFDPYFADVELLLHCDGSNGSATFTDSGPDARTVTANGNAQLATADAVFGTAAGRLDGNGDYLSIGTSSDWTWMHVANAVWTFETWMKLDSPTAGNTLFTTANGSTGNTGWYCAVRTDRYITLQGYRSVASTFVVNGTFATQYPNDSAAHHVEIVWDHSVASDNAMLFIDGVHCGSLTKTANAPSSGAPTTTLRIGTFGTAGVEEFDGAFDDLRLTRGVRRHTSGFTPPTEALPHAGGAGGWKASTFGTPSANARTVDVTGFMPTQFGTPNHPTPQFPAVSGFAAAAFGTPVNVTFVQPAGFMPAGFGQPALLPHAVGFMPARFGTVSALQAAGFMPALFGTASARCVNRVRSFRPCRFGASSTPTTRTAAVTGFMPVKSGYVIPIVYEPE